MNHKNIIKYSLTAIFLILFFLGSDIQAQDSDQSLYDQFKENLKTEYFQFGGFVQFRTNVAFGDPVKPGETGFSIPQARLKFNGNLNGGFSYKFQIDVADSYILTDAVVGYKYNSAFKVSFGAQKPGISAEFLQHPGSQEFASRSLIVRALTQNREMGVRFDGSLSENLSYSAGVFNGNRLGKNDNNQFYYTGRLAYSNEVSEGGVLDVGINAAYGEQNDTRIASGSLPNIDGERTIYGGDFRFENDLLILSSEVLAGNLEYTGFTGADNVFGYHLTGAYKFTDKTEGLVRWDAIQSDLLPQANRELIWLGFNAYPTGQTKVQLSYGIPADNSEFENHALTAHVHIKF